MLTKKSKKIMAYWVVWMWVMSMLAMPAHAGIIGTESYMANAPVEAQRASVMTFIQRQDTIDVLESQGISVKEAQARVSAMTAQEINQAYQNINDMPAGGDFIGTVAVVFVILLVTDIAGYTNIFPFVVKKR